MTILPPAHALQYPQYEAEGTDLAALQAVEDRVLWLSTAIIDHANRVRPNPGGLKVGGHQASSASMVSIMTALWFHCLGPDDRVSVKPHASPALHAINYLLGDLDPAYLPTLRDKGGLQSYPSRSKDPDRVDYSDRLGGYRRDRTDVGSYRAPLRQPTEPSPGNRRTAVFPGWRR